ncbi:hypothetical protein Gogos_005447 [Gossypium gossypioides]|uniref:RNase H type-1 domain-containing protein n=1 Tax=Gossypium gossypioides TaxID=34282 RepID=A0A7J9D145_GOSGO|nr:hypothetical protein [Gossypium gossypioides]
MGACTYPHINIADAFVAEARAYEQAIQFAQDISFHRVQIEGDSLTIIKKLHANTNDRSVLSLILADIKQRLGFFEQITFHHVKREANNAFRPWPRRGAEILRVSLGLVHRKFLFFAPMNKVKLRSFLGFVDGFMHFCFSRDRRALAGSV